MQSIEGIFKSYFIRLQSFAIHWVRTEEVAKDIVQDAFLSLSEQVDLLQKPEQVIKSYLFSTVKHLSFNHIRKDKSRTRLQANIPFQEDDEDDMMDNLIRAEVMGELYQELARLPEGCQHICRLIYFDGKKYEEVAGILNISINTVKSQRQRALRILKSRLLLLMIILYLLKLYL